ncbi:hypothetical protein AAGS61_20085 [Lysinibacillus sp. KU-BSD001]|uniref:hypothetical protein n=1 Tax=Lysinibacillus sp. KU-BSD001 TaxID=3141328 RepID=UPI0036EB5470
MHLIIACSKQLPIRYYPSDGVWIRRGSHFYNRTLPFFVEVEVQLNINRVQEYIVEIERQYKKVELEIITQNGLHYEQLCTAFPHAISTENRLYIVK